MILGRGGYGIVYAKDGVAVKSLEITDCGIRSLLEVSIMSTYKHEAIVSALSVAIEDGKLLIYQEIADCDLKTYIDERGGYRDISNSELLLKHFSTICAGIRVLHSANIIHGDLKPRNVLVYSSEVKLCDFGCSVIACSDGTRSVFGTVNYNAPEVLIQSIIHTASDIWSLGCVFYEMITGNTLVPSYEKNCRGKRALTAKSLQLWREEEGDAIDTRDKLQDSDILPVIFHVYQHADDIKMMTSYYPANRPTIDEIMEQVGIPYQGSNITCLCIDDNNYTRAATRLESYLLQRGILLELVDRRITKKATQILSASPSMSTEYLEAAIHMSCNMYQTNIANYHPVTTMCNIVKAELHICEHLGFRMHKFCHNKHYVKDVCK